MRIKICGITNIEDALKAYGLGADALGFIFYKNSKRFIDAEKVKTIISELPPFIEKIGVFVNEVLAEINRIAEYCGLTNAQLHGDESPEICDAVSVPVIKAFRVNENFDFEIMNNYKVNHFLLDAFDKNEYGGTGLKFNWNLIPSHLRKKIILAGGITIENLEEIICKISPAAIDLSSSVESEPGKKDHKKLKEFFEKFNELREKKC